MPDLVTTAKGIAGGLPLAGVTGRAELMDSVHPGGLGGTYGGNPVACAAALGAIDTMEKEDLPAAARAIESAMLPRLTKLAQANPVIGDVRGRGAMLALELRQAGHARARCGRRGQGGQDLPWERDGRPDLRHLQQRAAAASPARHRREPAQRGRRHSGGRASARSDRAGAAVRSG